MLLRLKLPSTSNVDYKKFLKELDKESREAMEGFLAKRSAVVQALAYGPDQVVEAIEGYLPSLVAVLEEVGGGMDIGALERGKFEWTMYLSEGMVSSTSGSSSSGSSSSSSTSSKKSKKGATSVQSLSFSLELIMVLQAYAVCHISAAADTMARCGQGEVDQAETAAVELLRRGAGIFNHIAYSNFGVWMDEDTRDAITDVSKLLMTTMSTLSLSMAQALMAGKALRENKSPRVAAALCIGVAEQFAADAQNLQDLDNDDGAINKDIINYARVSAQLWRARGFMQHATHKWDKESEYGEALGWAKAALAEAKGIDVPSSRKQGDLKALYAEAVATVKEIAATYDKWLKENDTIYLEVVPDQDGLTLTTAGKFVVSAIVYEMPDIPMLNLKLKESSKCCVQ